MCHSPLLPRSPGPQSTQNFGGVDRGLIRTRLFLSIGLELEPAGLFGFLLYAPSVSPYCQLRSTSVVPSPIPLVLPSLPHFLYANNNNNEDPFFTFRCHADAPPFFYGHCLLLSISTPLFAALRPSTYRQSFSFFGQGPSFPASGLLNFEWLITNFLAVLWPFTILFTRARAVNIILGFFTT